jgi:hypothetical protein
VVPGEIDLVPWIGDLKFGTGKFGPISSKPFELKKLQKK